MVRNRQAMACAHGGAIANWASLGTGQEQVCTIIERNAPGSEWATAFLSLSQTAVDPASIRRDMRDGGQHHRNGKPSLDADRSST